MQGCDRYDLARVACTIMVIPRGCSPAIPPSAAEISVSVLCGGRTTGLLSLWGGVTHARELRPPQPHNSLPAGLGFAWTRQKSARRGPRLPKPTPPPPELIRGLPPAYPQGTYVSCACTRAERSRALARTCTSSARRATLSGAAALSAECGLPATPWIAAPLGACGGRPFPRPDAVTDNSNHRHPWVPVPNPTSAPQAPVPLPPPPRFAGSQRREHQAPRPSLGRFAMATSWSRG